MVAKSEINREQYCTRPRNDLTSVTVIGAVAFSTAATFSSLGVNTIRGQLVAIEGQLVQPEGTLATIQRQASFTQAA